MAKTEKEVGKEAARMLRTKLRAVIQRSGLNLSNEKGSMGRASSSYRMVRGAPTQLRGIAVLMPRHGFIQNYGVDTTRTSHIVKSPQGKHFIRKEHSFKLKKNPVLEELMKDSSSVVDFVADEISRLRAEEVVLQIKNYLEK